MYIIILSILVSIIMAIIGSYIGLWLVDNWHNFFRKKNNKILM